MKRLFVLAVSVLMALAVSAQKVYGDRPGWTVYTSEDEYSGKKSHCLRYYDPMRGKQVTKKISLAGFTKCYNECLRRYGVKVK